MTIKERFDTADAETVRRFVSERVSEDLYLEFMVARAPYFAQKGERQELAKALTGFANSDGGLVVWGVEAKRIRTNSPDVACGLQPIQDLAAFVSRLNELTGEAASSPVAGVQHRQILDADGSGFAITLVPASGTGPHMAKLGVDRFYRRSGSSFRRMETFEIDDMFGRRPHPQLSVEHRHSWSLRNRSLSEGSGRTVTMHQLEVVLAVTNVGKGAAEAPYFGVKISSPYQISRYGLDGNGHEGFDRQAGGGVGGFTRFGSNRNVVLHAGSSHDVCKIVAEARQDATNLADLTIDFEIAAIGVPVDRGRIVLGGADVLEELVDILRAEIGA